VVLDFLLYFLFEQGCDVIGKNRKTVLEKLERALFEESGWRCSVPACRLENVDALEMAHIVPVEKGGKNDFENMIVLCRNCHIRFDREKEKTIDRLSMRRLKKNLSIINGRYSHFRIPSFGIFFSEV
jgi:5-methylcytosine-specific restriction endonuclease McrA